MSGELKVGGSSLISDSGGSGALTWGSGVPDGSSLKVSSVYSETRIALASSSNKEDRNALWEFTINKLSSDSDLYLNIQLHARVRENGNGSWHIGVKSGGSVSTWVKCGGGPFGAWAEYSMNVSLAGVIPKAQTGAGDNVIVLAWSSATGKIFSVWNPTSTDGGDEQHYAGRSTIICHEVKS